MQYSLHTISRIITSTAPVANLQVEYLLLDSRKVYFPASSLFFALKGPRRDGHQFIPELYKKGVRSFVVSEVIDKAIFPDAEFLKVQDTLLALQELTASHRARFEIPVIGITGSNGKTIVKEWLYQLLHHQYRIVRSPKSYNSQVGVPLSIWQMEDGDQLGIFEAGISQVGEMEHLEHVIQPTIGILTNMGEAHSEGFSDKDQKLAEKLKLFSRAKLLIGREADLVGRDYITDPVKKKSQIITWGYSRNNTLIVKRIEKSENSSVIFLSYQGLEKKLVIPFMDDASVENAITCYLTLAYLGVSEEDILDGMLQLQPVNMRLELKNGINHCTLINDSYSADLDSLEIALNFLAQQSHGAKKTVILSDLLQSSESNDKLYSYIANALRKHGVTRLIGIGENISEALRHVKGGANDELSIELFLTTRSYILQYLSSQFKEETILVKGARVFGFEEIVSLLEHKVHQTILEINLNALVHNVKVYQSRLKPTTKIMAMVKAFAYGSGGAEIAGILQYHQLDYLGVAYIDEGIELRRAGVTLPVMVLNPEESAFESIVEYNLEPDIFSFDMLQSFGKFLEQEGIQRYPIHIEIETGMNRLGFAEQDIEKLAVHLSKSTLLKVQTVFTHLSSSEDPKEDEFTMQQFHRFERAAEILKKQLPYSFIRHVANTAAIFRLPEIQLDMVRLGIGMYGVDSAVSHQSLLQPVATLKTTIAQIKHLKKGESVSYNRRGKLERDSIIATVRIGYADGYSRRLGNGVAKMLVKGKLAPIVGTVCMDMTMIDVTDIDNVQERDEVIIFGNGLPVQQLAAWQGTIPYEIMTGISQRVKRVYFEE